MPAEAMGAAVGREGLERRRGAWRSLRFWPIARVGIGTLLRRRVFWIFLAISLMNFLFHSSMIYLQAQLRGKLGARLPAFLERSQEGFIFTGKGEAYHEFILLQDIVLMILLGLGGGILVGADFRSGAVPFYLARPVTRLDYFLGKLASLVALGSLVTLVPAVLLFIEYGAFTESAAYYFENLRILGAILIYGSLAAGIPSIVLLGLASLLRRTVPLLFAWGGLFAFLPAATSVVREAQRRRGGSDPWGWGLLDLWADLRWVSGSLFGIREEIYAQRWPWAAAALAAAAGLALWLFWRRLTAEEVVR